MEVAVAMDGHKECGNGFFTEFSCSTMRKIYCDCGRILDLDSHYFVLKQTLRKKVECPSCRNNRIAFEIQELNDHFDPPPEEDGIACF